MSIRSRITLTLAILLTTVLGLSALTSSRYTSHLLTEGVSQTRRTLRKAAQDEARSVFDSLEIGTKGSVQRGEMELFAELLVKLGRIRNVLEIGLSDPQGKIKYSNRPRALGQRLREADRQRAISSRARVQAYRGDERLVFLKAQRMTKGCLSCHSEAKVGDLAGVLYVQFDLEPLRREEKRLDQLAASSERKSLIFSLLIGLGTLVIVFVAISWLLGGQVIRPLQWLRTMIRQVERGNLDHRLTVAKADEIGVAAGALNQMADQLGFMVARIDRSTRALTRVSEVIEEASVQVTAAATSQSSAVGDASQAVTAIKHSVDQVGDRVGVLNQSATESSVSVQQMSVSIEQVADSATTLAESSERIGASVSAMVASISATAERDAQLQEASEASATSVTQMEGAIRDVERNAQQTSSITDQVRQDALQGHAAVEATIHGIHEIRSAYEITSEVVASLSSKTRSIGSILSVIDDVTDQTNLLALNAAIIAAQAGEQGRGFAVVAEEIRALADRTSASTRDIAEVIGGLQNETRRAVEALDAVDHRIADGHTLSLQAGEALQKIVTGVQDAAERMVRIARATVDQSQGIRTINTTVAKVTESLAQSAKSSREQSHAVGVINQAVQRMQDMTDQVRRSTREQSDASKIIARSMADITERTGQIRSACGQQQTYADRIIHAVELISLSTGEGLDASRSLNEVVTDLGAETRDLQRGVSSFHVDRPPK